MKSKGFTLLEVIITLVILTAMILLISRSLQQTILFKKTLQLQLDDTSRIQEVIRVLEGDIQMAFHYTDYFKTIDEMILKKNQAEKKTPTPQTPTPPPTPPEVLQAKPIDPETHFVGDEKSMAFVTMNNSAFFSTEPQADFVTVGYSVKSCRSLNNDAESSNCLWRRVSRHVGPDPTKGGEEVAILDNITEFKLRYRGLEKDDWITNWRSNSKSDTGTISRFPDAVEISLKLEKKDQGKTRKYSFQYVIPLHFPNNSSKENRK